MGASAQQRFGDGAIHYARKTVRFRDHPGDVLRHFWKQGGAFAPTGLFFRTVDDAHADDSARTGIWVYEITHPIRDGAEAKRIGFINILYSPDRPVAKGKRDYELEGLEVASIPNGAMAGTRGIYLIDYLKRAGRSKIFFSNRPDPDLVYFR